MNEYIQSQSVLKETHFLATRDRLDFIDLMMEAQCQKGLLALSRRLKCEL